MPIVCGVRFRGAGKVYYFDPQGIEDLQVDEYVIVDTARGTELGRVAAACAQVTDAEVVAELKPVLRRATNMDLVESERYRQREPEAIRQCREQVTKLELPMKIVNAEYSFDGSRLTFFFTSEQRVDFRNLVRDLAHQFKTRIELRQIGVRDEARLIGGVGKCGRPLCCATWLADFSPVSIRMAKAQNLPLSPMEISGLCGRLLCCLTYENEYYQEIKDRFPKVGKMVETPLGPAKVIQVSVLRETVRLLLENGSTLDLTADQLAGNEPIDEATEKHRPALGERVDEAVSAALGSQGGAAPSREQRPATSGASRTEASRPGNQGRGEPSARRDQAARAPRPAPIVPESEGELGDRSRPAGRSRRRRRPHTRPGFGPPEPGIETNEASLRNESNPRNEVRAQMPRRSAPQTAQFEGRTDEQEEPTPRRRSNSRRRRRPQGDQGEGRRDDAPTPRPEPRE